MNARRMRNKTKWLFFRFMYFACIIVGLFMLVGLKNAVTSLEYELADLNMEKVALLRNNKQLTGQRASIYSAETIEAFATERLGMKIPDRENIILVKRTAAAGPHKVSMGAISRARQDWPGNNEH
jgi:cell division protein FtsL